MFFRYSKNSSPALNGVNFIIKPKEKIGVVGRTGAGKSSLVKALLRMADIDGTIIVDGVNTNKISLRALRSKISIIPQVPILFSDSVRKNLDPLEEYNDEVRNKLIHCQSLESRLRKSISTHFKDKYKSEVSFLDHVRICHNVWR